MLARFSFLIILLGFLSIPAIAQESPASGPYDQEVAGFKAYCLNEPTLGPQYNCDCLAAQFLNKRTTLGPGPKSPEIIQMLNPAMCPSESALKTQKELAEIPEEAIKDAEDFEKSCAGDVRMYSTFDCECLAGEYLNARITAGPDTSRSSLLLSINHTCPNIEEAAGEAYSECYSQATIMPPAQPIEEYCTCYAKAYAKMRKELKTELHSQLRIALKARAMGSCQPKY